MGLSQIYMEDVLITKSYEKIGHTKQRLVLFVINRLDINL